MQYEYRVIPAPAKGRRAQGAKSSEARFAATLQQVMNEMGGEGWEYQRAEMLPSEERQGLTGSATIWRNMLVFRRPRREATDNFEPKLLEAPGPAPAPAMNSAIDFDPDTPGQAAQAAPSPALLARARQQNAPTPLHPPKKEASADAPEIAAQEPKKPDKPAAPEQPRVRGLRRALDLMSGNAPGDGSGRTGTDR